MSKICAAACVVLAATVTPVYAIQVILSSSSVVGSSGALSASFIAQRVVDQQVGAISDTFGSTYWLNSDNTGSTPIYITIDLGSPQVIESFDLFNTHNAFYNDRGTGAFRIVASNSVVTAGVGNLRVSGGDVIVSSTLTNATGVPIAQSFLPSSSTAYRYLSFEPLSALSPFGQTPSPTSYGLNEIRVFASAIPEAPQFVLLMCGLGLVGFRLLRDHRRAV